MVIFPFLVTPYFVDFKSTSVNLDLFLNFVVKYSMLYKDFVITEGLNIRE